MSFAIIISGIALFLASALIHILHWRWNKPKNDIAALFFDFFVIPFILLSALIFMPNAKPFPFLNFSFVECASIFFLHSALSSLYISTYPAAQASSPTLEILLMYRHSPTGGITREEILKHFEGKSIVSDRIMDLVNSSLVVQESTKYRLTLPAKLMVQFYSSYRKLLGLPVKGK